MGSARIEEAAKPLDEPKNLYLALISPGDRPGKRCVEGRRVATGSQDADPFHGAL
jgi:hypothetical protein